MGSADKLSTTKIYKLIAYATNISLPFLSSFNFVIKYQKQFHVPSLFKSHISPSSASYTGGPAKPQISSGQQFYKLSSNENLLGSSPLALQAIRQHINSLHEYPEPTGKSLQIALSQYYKDELTPDQFITANSGVAIIDLIIAAFLERDLECIVSNPAFSPYTRFAEKVGAIVKDVPLIGDALHLDVDGILKAITDRTRVIWLCSPNNPSGTYIPKQQIDMLIDQLPEHVVLVYDEVYRHFVAAQDYTIGLPYVTQRRQVIALNSFSKAYGLAGLRVGYAYSTPEIASYLNFFRRPFFINTLSLEAAKAALLDKDFIKKTKENTKLGKSYLYEQFDLLGLQYYKSETNFILVKPNIDTATFVQALYERKIMVRPTDDFAAPGYVRITIGTTEANQALIHALGEVLALSN